MSDCAIDFDQARRSSVTCREQFASPLLNLNRVCGDEHPARPSTKKVEHGHVRVRVRRGSETCRVSIEVQSIQFLLKVRFQLDQELIEQRVESDNVNVFSFDSKSIEQRLGEIVVLSDEIEVSEMFIV